MVGRRLGICAVAFGREGRDGQGICLGVGEAVWFVTRLPSTRAKVSVNTGYGLTEDAAAGGTGGSGAGPTSWAKALCAGRGQGTASLTGRGSERVSPGAKPDSIKLFC